MDQVCADGPYCLGPIEARATADACIADYRVETRENFEQSSRKAMNGAERCQI